LLLLEKAGLQLQLIEELLILLFESEGLALEAVFFVFALDSAQTRAFPIFQQSVFFMG
jgi:hypothetical protein